MLLASLVTLFGKDFGTEASKESYWPTLIGSSCQPEAALVFTSSSSAAAAFMAFVCSVQLSCIDLGVVAVCSLFHSREVPSRNIFV